MLYGPLQASKGLSRLTILNAGNAECAFLLVDAMADPRPLQSAKVSLSVSEL
jgi:hypothetical protein